ncbi:MAG TPA: rRNA (cytidine-2'-O-)-methyltransferase, partial [Coprothermobacter sp.]|nr:rRNA (cytidine-2'-O-)-methyltransferase [Coprothermobacter sp.]
KLLSLLNELCPQRKVALLRELTKLHEEVLVGYPQELIKDSYKGEFVVVIYPPEEGT